MFSRRITMMLRVGLSTWVTINHEVYASLYRTKETLSFSSLFFGQWVPLERAFVITSGTREWRCQKSVLLTPLREFFSTFVAVRVDSSQHSFRWPAYIQLSFILVICFFLVSRVDAYIHDSWSSTVCIFFYELLMHLIHVNTNNMSYSSYWRPLLMAIYHVHRHVCTRDACCSSKREVEHRENMIRKSSFSRKCRF